SKVFICSAEFLSTHFKTFGIKPENIEHSPTFRMGNLIYDKNVPVDISLQAIFSRHCAVVGTTGGGKSYTISKFIEGVIETGAKAIILDPTGEYSTFDTHPKVDHSTLITDSYFPYQNLTINDLFVLFRPSGQVQQPILLEAIKSLKVAHCLLANIPNNGHNQNGTQDTFSFRTQEGQKLVVVENGLIVKQNNSTLSFNNACHIYKSIIEDFSRNDFDIKLLYKQIINEFYFINGTVWSQNRDERNYGN